MAAPPERLSRWLELFDAIDDRVERIQLLIDVADRWKPVPETVAVRPYPESHKTPACESEVYVFAQPLPDGTLKFHFAVENPQGISARALAVLLDETLSGAPLDQALAVPGDLPERVFGRELSMGKNMGLSGMIAMVQSSARAQMKKAD